MCGSYVSYFTTNLLLSCHQAFSTPARLFWRQQLLLLLQWDSKYEIESLNAVHHSGSDPLGCVHSHQYSSICVVLDFVPLKSKMVMLLDRFLSGTFIHDKICRGDYWQDATSNGAILNEEL